MIALLPILRMYNVNFIVHGLAELCCIFITIYVVLFRIFANRKKPQNPPNLLNDVFLLCLSITICLLFVSSIINVSAEFHFNSLVFMIIIVAIVLGCKWGAVDHKVLIKSYLFLSLLSCIYLLFQFVIFKTLSVYLPAKLLPLESIEFYDASSDYYLTGTFRPQSFFSEPSVFADFVIPSFAFFVFAKKKTFKVFVSLIVIGLSVLLSTSTMGLASIAIILLFYIWSKNKKSFFKLVVALSLLALVGIVIVNTNQYASKVFNDLMANGLGSGKIRIRVMRGFAVFYNLPSAYQIFGCGVGNGDYYIRTFNIVTKYESQWGEEIVEYFNALSSCLIYGGIIATIPYFLCHVFLFCQSRSYISKSLVLTLFLMLFTSSIFFSTNYLFVIVLVYSFNSTSVAKKERVGVLNNLVICQA